MPKRRNDIRPKRHNDIRHQEARWHKRGAMTSRQTAGGQHPYGRMTSAPNERPPSSRACARHATDTRGGRPSPRSDRPCTRSMMTRLSETQARAGSRMQRSRGKSTGGGGEQRRRTSQPPAPPPQPRARAPPRCTPARTPACPIRAQPRPRRTPPPSSPQPPPPPPDRQRSEARGCGQNARAPRARRPPRGPHAPWRRRVPRAHEPSQAPRRARAAGGRPRRRATRSPLRAPPARSARCCRR